MVVDDSGEKLTDHGHRKPRSGRGGITDHRASQVVIMRNPYDSNDGGDSNKSDVRRSNMPSMSIATWNVKTLHQPGKLANAESEMERMNWDVLGMSEVRWKGEGVIDTAKGNTLFFSGGDSSQHGVGILISAKNIKCVKSFLPLSERIMLIKLKGQPIDINLIQIYAPTAERPEDELEEFYADLKKIRKHTKQHEINIYMGDWNAKVGGERVENVTGPYGLGSRNERGSRFIEFCQENHLVVTNTCFKLPCRRLYTWKSPQDRRGIMVRNQIDYITINSRFRNGVLDAKTYPGCDINSDHNPVVITLRVKLKTIKRPKPVNRIDWNNASEEKKEQYKEYVDKQLNAGNGMRDNPPRGNIEQRWLTIRNVMTRGGEDAIGKERKKGKKPWMTEEILALMEKRRKYKSRNELEYRRINKEIGTQIKEAKEKWLSDQCDEVEKLQEQHRYRELHQKIRNVTGLCKPKQVSLIVNENNEVELDPDKQKQIWERYLKQLFGDRRTVTPPEVEKGENLPILLSEVNRAIKETKSNKAPGEDYITAEHFKNLSDRTTRNITQLFNEVYESGEIPPDWLKSTFIALPKKNKARKCEDHRTISLMSHAAKIFMRIIFNRIQDKCDEYLSRSQYGFRKGTGTREAILGLSLIAERYLEVQRDLYVCFVDYKKAFDRIEHQRLIEVLQEIGLDGREIIIIRNIYWKHKGCVRTENGNTDYIDIQRGVRQGCLLSPLLFNVYAEYIIRSSLQNRSEGAKINGVIINNIRYADDTVVIAETEEQLQSLMSVLTEESNRAGLEVNAAKTKTMVFTRKANQHNTSININGQNLESVQSYIYLGREMNKTLDHSREIRRRIEIARSGFTKMRSLLCHPKLAITIRLRTLKCYIWSLLLYGCETWTLKQDDIKKIEAFEIWLYRRMLKISWTSRTTNETVLNRMNTRPHLASTIKIRKTSYLGHVMRHKEYEQIQLILEGKIDGKRGIGRKKKSWLRNIRDWTHTSGNDLIHRAKDRENYAILIANLNREGT